MVMIAYLDESGTHGDGSPAVILGGFIANESAWPAYESDLQALFSVHALDHFHANKFRKRSGSFKGWSAAQQRVLPRHKSTHGRGIRTDGPHVPKRMRSFRLDESGRDAGRS
jgi:hypothetical protein